ncbi:hypothetical protein [Enterococcus wangshanyuanii]|uniref:Uncharacterized protein n=1 Tax=Enterococcus wangshanyuanii TaxID=2005703 RepID=A0ABQ1PID0_9ENTE|nr:hypothetical protein [Enterococcus wangshanyuanii]GGC97820.1 hypothetical protein GCM10011573_29190 [Enterococcus wangshanyuanii]
MGENINSILSKNLQQIKLVGRFTNLQICEGNGTKQALAESAFSKLLNNKQGSNPSLDTLERICENISFLFQNSNRKKLINIKVTVSDLLNPFYFIEENYDEIDCSKLRFKQFYVLYYIIQVENRPVKLKKALLKVEKNSEIKAIFNLRNDEINVKDISSMFDNVFENNMKKYDKYIGEILRYERNFSIHLSNVEKEMSLLFEIPKGIRNKYIGGAGLQSSLPLQGTGCSPYTSFVALSNKLLSAESEEELVDILSLTQNTTFTSVNKEDEIEEDYIKILVETSQNYSYLDSDKLRNQAIESLVNSFADFQTNKKVYNISLGGGTVDKKMFSIIDSDKALDINEGDVANG